jgi:hypothetical protein
MQTAVLDNPLLGSPGDLADHFTASNGDIVSKTNTGEVPVAFGTMVAASGEALAANDDALGGIVTRAHAYATPQELVDTASGTANGLTTGVTYGCGRTGRYLVLIEDDVEAGDPVHVRAVATTGEQVGAFRPDKDGSDTINCSDFCSWVVGGAVDGDSGFGFAVLEVNMGLAPLATADS